MRMPHGHLVYIGEPPQLQRSLLSLFPLIVYIFSINRHQMNVPFKGTFARLRLIEPPAIEVVAKSKPSNCKLIFDHFSLAELSKSSLEALTHEMYENEIVLPELALDSFDLSDKQTRKETREVHSAPVSHLKAKCNINSELKKILLNSQASRLIKLRFQKAYEYDFSVINDLNLSRNLYDMRLLVSCAVYYTYLYPERTIVLVLGSDATYLASVREAAERYNIQVVLSSEVMTCGDTIK
ncbi:hypothetical protein AGDE_14303 [Angomonas deanei]|nr:hypothetical protein AGDE_14303 [Angomonas deanei]|eukprot:EPY21079.1 hypothetical protein AGDE_14303 [Angomonas deanei]